MYWIRSLSLHQHVISESPNEYLCDFLNTGRILSPNSTAFPQILCQNPHSCTTNTNTTIMCLNLQQWFHERIISSLGAALKLGHFGPSTSFTRAPWIEWSRWGICCGLYPTLQSTGVVIILSEINPFATAVCINYVELRAIKVH